MLGGTGAVKKNQITLARTREDIERRASRVAAATRAENKIRREIATVLKAATRISGDGEEVGGTALTILKRRQPPVATLIEKGLIGGEEVRAADDISRAVFAIAGALRFKPLSLEKVDKSHSPNHHVGTIDAIARYQSWANYWSKRSKRGDKTLEVVWATVIDERPFSVIEDDLRMRHGRAALSVIIGLRDYAERAGWVDRRLADQWRAEALRRGPARRPRAA